MFDATSIIIQYHLFLALALVIAGLIGIAIRTLVKRRWFPGFFNISEYLIIAALVVVYVFGQV